MSKIGVFLKEIESKLSAIDGIKTLKVGMEKGIGSKDSPFIRIVSERNSKMNGKGAGYSCDANGKGGMQEMTIKIIFGFDLKNHELPKLYDTVYDLEEAIRDALLTKYVAHGSMDHIESVADEDELATLKSAISRFKIIGIR